MVTMLLIWAYVPITVQSWDERVKECTDIYQKDKPNETRYYQCWKVLDRWLES